MGTEIRQVVTEDGEVLVLVPLALYQSLSDRAGSPSSFRRAFFETVPAEVRADIKAGHCPLAAWRRYRDLTQNQLSILSGVSRHTIMRMEATGRGSGNAASRRRLAEALGVEIGEL